MSPAELTEYLHRNIPLTRAMGVAVLECGEDGVRLGAPLAPNLNHHNTAFGGSLATLGIVASWTLLYAGLRRQQVEARLVIQKQECEFLAPAADQLTACSFLPADWPRFVAALQSARRARIEVVGEVRCAGAIVVKSSGTFVGLP